MFLKCTTLLASITTLKQWKIKLTSNNYKNNILIVIAAWAVVIKRGASREGDAAISCGVVLTSLEYIDMHWLSWTFKVSLFSTVIDFVMTKSIHPAITLGMLFGFWNGQQLSDCVIVILPVCVAEVWTRIFNLFISCTREIGTSTKRVRHSCQKCSSAAQLNKQVNFLLGR